MQEIQNIQTKKRVLNQEKEKEERLKAKEARNRSLKKQDVKNNNDESLYVTINLGQTKPENKDSSNQNSNLRVSEELKVMLTDPAQLLRIKPVGSLSDNIDLGMTVLKQGDYYYLPQFQDTRLYRHCPKEEERFQKPEELKSGFGEFVLVCSFYCEVQILVS